MPESTFRTRAQLVGDVAELSRELKRTQRQLVSSYRIKEMYKARAAGRPRCYACDSFAVGVRDRSPEGGNLELACERHSEATGIAASEVASLPTATSAARHVSEVVQLDRDCELGKRGELAVVTSVDGMYMSLVFAHRAPEHREVLTGADYRYLRSV